MFVKYVNPLSTRICVHRPRSTAKIKIYVLAALWFYLILGTVVFHTRWIHVYVANGSVGRKFIQNCLFHQENSFDLDKT